MVIEGLNEHTRNFILEIINELYKGNSELGLVLAVLTEKKTSEFFHKNFP